MNTINLLTLSNLYESTNSVDQYINQRECEVKDSELEIINKIIDKLKMLELEEDSTNYIYDNFLVGYTIPHISKEFDLLRFGENYHINIELKTKADEDKVLSQLIKNKYYLEFLNRDLKIFSYVYESDILYRLNEDNKLEECSFEYLYNILNQQNLENLYPKKVIDFNELFDINNYLVSPFNSPGKFLEDSYFLTNHQNEIKKTIDNIINNKSNNDFNILGLKGSPGTGKTLLAYDIAKDQKRNNKKVKIIHCGKLNKGHEHLIKFGEFSISPIKYLDNILMVNNYDLLIVDEAQRIKESQFEDLIDFVKSKNTNIIFCYDPKQCLSTYEWKLKFDEKIQLCVTSEIFKLSNKLRTNPTIAQFIKCLFDKENKKENKKVKNMKDFIHVEYLKDSSSAQKYIYGLKSRGWKVLNYTDSFHCNEPEIYDLRDIGVENSHEVIGQEFDNVVVYLNENFTYYDGKLICISRTYYDKKGMLFQNLTRAKKSLCLVVIDNIDIFNYCIDVINYYS